jgi:hypothetical protein
MDEQSKAALDLLVQNGYLEIVKEKYRATKKLNAVPVTVAVNTSLGVLSFPGTWEEFYTKFIVDCKIPRNSENGQGGIYPINQYSEDGMKRFREMLTVEGIKYDLLMGIIQTYYRTGANRYKKTIGNYITEGHWRMDYSAMKGQTTEQQQQHINEQLNSAQPFTRDRIG